ncbi:hypothetical protein L3Y34_005839 [Caenorhabditis briggsae]|uniref:Uncharacterized protein n=2 Tax=Caenorhabditis briggsae TaxID=6238 RepID=A0AAE9CX55_CAEBR|nr:hypothetical protein L3Y34_005839 [Caenorhabditis briggsae]
MLPLQVYVNVLLEVFTLLVGSAVDELTRHFVETVPDRHDQLVNIHHQIIQIGLVSTDVCSSLDCEHSFDATTRLMMAAIQVPFEAGKAISQSLKCFNDRQSAYTCTCGSPGNRTITFEPADVVFVLNDTPESDTHLTTASDYLFSFPDGGESYAPIALIVSSPEDDVLVVPRTRFHTLYGDEYGAYALYGVIYMKNSLPTFPRLL